MAPEQARGLPDVDGRANIYALGCVLFEILTGEPLHPRPGDTTQLTTADPRARRASPPPPPGLAAPPARAALTDRVDRGFVQRP